MGRFVILGALRHSRQTVSLLAIGVRQHVARDGCIFGIWFGCSRFATLMTGTLIHKVYTDLKGGTSQAVMLKLKAFKRDRSYVDYDTSIPHWRKGANTDDPPLTVCLQNCRIERYQKYLSAPGAPRCII